VIGAEGLPIGSVKMDVPFKKTWSGKWWRIFFYTTYLYVSAADEISYLTKI
jgi:hypothetical protein